MTTIETLLEDLAKLQEMVDADCFEVELTLACCLRCHVEVRLPRLFVQQHLLRLRERPVLHRRTAARALLKRLQ